MRTQIHEPSTFSDAAVMVESCHTELLRVGCTKEAAALRGIEIFSENDAQCALATLQRISATGNEQADNAVQYALGAVIAVLRGPAPVALAS